MPPAAAPSSDPPTPDAPHEPCCICMEVDDYQGTLLVHHVFKPELDTTTDHGFALGLLGQQ
ncbi:hypothetical protein PHYSODRAFT_325868 [Phytophthora sojae]|uniref:Uncharacterized protein n=1 Tax=Phytophthora sojae (strain P6497) TaxID=1094619 RepID=G4YTQ8_PHYSP|nr:hypothetical protein PHYSODRAFT_325868 [Phytophthora sojae]EGZ24795.1 hypothetical protein PHYSODRAFT_325868 [Phytophthora sojae]|eukprot:XP_009520083.1 hypothetical protein PHYSODRAFT_325868 [Phytophthora sojae]